ncbi:tRNA uridine-5-carboxymethylaminomethyl(34) synthesis GTPase MnmE [Candidatus Dependentiae bacterium]|nr:tRNA uridine-5-carboxymethylaminomethyl(34) synthesis GTPase MnmE [Candidatus Dependentiae bacterium]
MTKVANKLLTKDQESVIAQCTPKGSGAIALLRVSGFNAFELISKICKLSSKQPITCVKTHTINHGFIVDGNVVVDEVLFFAMRAPKTFTGQDTIEISCHNNQFIIQKIMELAISAGARLAERGEFTQRAFLNKKIDLVQAESINEIINAQTELALKKSMSQLKGELSGFINQIEERIFYLLSLVEGSLEFFEEEQQDLDINNQIKQEVLNILDQLNLLKLNFNQQKLIKDGIKICFLGGVNTGKSTLFNAILKKDRAIVTDIAGTTRDIVESCLYKEGNFWQLTDTAGIRSTNDIIEKRGIDLSFEQAKISDIILLILDSSKILSEEQFDVYKRIIKNYNKKIIFILNKIDIQDIKVVDNIKNEFPYDFIEVSSKKNIGLQKLEFIIENKIQKLFEKLESPFLLNGRQYNLVLKLIDDFKFIEQKLLVNLEHEILAHHLKQILENVASLTGRNINEKMLDKVFSEFCVGK